MSKLHEGIDLLRSFFFITFASVIPVESHWLHFLEFRQFSLCQFLCLIHYLSMLPVRRVKIITNLCTLTYPITYLCARTVNLITTLCARTCMHVRRCMLPAMTPKQSGASSMHTTCEHHGSPMQQSQTSFSSSFSSALPSSLPPLARNSQESPAHVLSKLFHPPFCTAIA